MSEYFEVITNAKTGAVIKRVFTAAEVAERTKPPSAGVVRAKRDHILATVVDPLVSNPLRWADMTPETQQAWGDYRRALLDVPQQVGFPNAVDWPTQPPF